MAGSHSPPLPEGVWVWQKAPDGQTDGQTHTHTRQNLYILATRAVTNLKQRVLVKTTKTTATVVLLYRFLFSIFVMFKQTDKWQEVYFPWPNRTWQVMAVSYVYFHATPSTFLIWNNLCDLVYQTSTRTYRSLTVVSFGIPVMWLPRLHTKHLPAMPC